MSNSRRPVISRIAVALVLASALGGFGAPNAAAAADKGHAVAQWKLGRMYAEGDGVPQSDLRAFEYFRSIADGLEYETADETEASAPPTS